MNQLKQICVSRIDRIGDLIMTTPALQVIRENWPKSKITLLVSKINSEVLKHSMLIDEIIIVDKKISLLKKLIILKDIRDKSFDIFINLSPTNLSYFYCFFSKAKNKSTLIFTSRYKKNSSKIFLIFFSKIFCNYVYIVNRWYLFNHNKEMHQSKMMIKLIERISEKTFSYPNLKISVVSKLENKIKIIFFKKIITIHLSKKWINNYYKITDLKNLLLNLQNNQEFIFFLTTEKINDNSFNEITLNYPYLFTNDFDNKELVNDKIKKSNILILNEYSYNDWASIIKQSYKIISPDSGCCHIAAAFNVPLVVIYDNDNLPEYIYKEYAPQNINHEKLIFKENNNINNFILDKLN